MATHDAGHIEQLAKTVIDEMDMDDLVNYAMTQLENHYLENEESFHEDWNMRMD